MNSVLSKYLFYFPTTMLNGEHVHHYLKLYRHSQYWNKDAIESFQEQELKALLWAASTSEFYKERVDFNELLVKTGKDFFSSFSRNVPVLVKQDLIENKSAMKTDIRGRFSEKTTGGSTGEPVTVYKNSVGLARERAATWRAYEWAGVSIGTRQARFWGVPHTKKGKLKARLIDFVANRKRFSAFDLDPESLANIADEILRYKPDYLYGYVSAIRELAEYVCSTVKGRYGHWPMKCVITTSEVLTGKDREIIESAFMCRVFNEYGCGEVGSIAHECKHGSMHIMSENVYLEQSDEGELIVTDLHNTLMPLIRYKIGDFASLDDSNCSCGVQLPVLKNIGGRVYDMIKTPEGRVIHPESVIYIFEDFQRQHGYFKHFQVIQTSSSNLVINLVPTEKWNDKGVIELKQKISDSISNRMSVDIRVVNSILREISGKMRVVKYAVESK